jgi:tRNA 2-thiouridine synthesizing protein A
MSDTPVKSVDLKGLMCPMPIIKISRAIKEVNIGELVEAFASDPGVMADVPAWCRSTGHQLVSLEKLERQFHFMIRRTK